MPGDVEWNAAGAVTLAVALVALVIASAAWRAVLKTGNRSIVFVAAGFGVFFFKNTLKGIGLVRGMGESGPLELLFSLLDLAAVALVAWPILKRRRGENA